MLLFVFCSDFLWLSFGRKLCNADLGNVLCRSRSARVEVKWALLSFRAELKWALLSFRAEVKWALLSFRLHCVTVREDMWLVIVLWLNSYLYVNYLILIIVIILNFLIWHFFYSSSTHIKEMCFLNVKSIFLFFGFILGITWHSDHQLRSNFTPEKNPCTSTL